MVSLVILIWIKSIEVPELICIGKKDGSIECKNYHESVDVPKRNKYQIVTFNPNPTPAPEPTPAPGHPVYNFGNVRITGNLKEYSKTLTFEPSSTLVENFPPKMTLTKFTDPTTTSGGGLWFSLPFSKAPQKALIRSSIYFESWYFIYAEYSYLNSENLIANGKLVFKITVRFLPNTIPYTSTPKSGVFFSKAFSDYEGDGAIIDLNPTSDGNFIFHIPVTDAGAKSTSTPLNCIITFGINGSIVGPEFHLTYPAFSSQLDGSIASYEANPSYS